MGGKSGSKIEIAEYSMSMHIGVAAWGRGMQLLRVTVGEKEIWRGQARSKTAFVIERTDLFGGERKEGGVKGIMTWLPGERNQSLPGYIWSRLGLTRATAPGFRGLATLFFSGTVDSVNPASGDPGEIADYAEKRDGLHSRGNSGKTAGFYWGANNPYLRKITAKVRRAPQGLNPSIALIRIPDSSTGVAQYAANPAHIIFECMTDRDWGMGSPINAFDVPSFEACAQTLFDEGFGLNLIWTRQSEIQKFIGEALDHIQATLYVDARTGKHTMKLLRGDYDINTLPRITPSNAGLSNFRRKTWGEVVSEVVVTMTNAETGKEETVTVQDLAASMAQGGNGASSGKNYHGVPYQALAIQLAERDLAASVYPLATCEATVTRAFWQSFVGEVVEVSWPEHEIERVIMRISEVDAEGEKIKLALYEDIFGAERASYLDPAETGWLNPTRDPEPLTLYQIGTAPAFMTAAALGASDPGELDFPEAVTGLVIGPDSDDDTGYDLVTYVRDVNGVQRQRNIGTRSLAATFILPLQLPAEATSFNVDIAALRGTAPQQGDFILIGGGDDAVSEICTVEAINSGGKLVLNRGTLDTVPRTWPPATRAWVIPDAAAVPDATVRAVGEVVTYWPRTRTSAGILDLNSTPEVVTTLTNRAYRPNRPANVRVGGVAFGTATVPAGQGVPVTWANRNRTLESTQIVKWGEASVAPEAGQVTQIDLLNMQGGIITSFPNLTGTAFTVPRSAFGGATNAYVQVVAVRSGIVSLQGHMVEVYLP